MSHSSEHERQPLVSTPKSSSHHASNQSGAAAAAAGTSSLQLGVLSPDALLLSSSSPEAAQTRWPGGSGGIVSHLSNDASNSRMHASPSPRAAPSWRVAFARRWALMRRWDWNLICMSGIALFFFLLYMTSPEGKFMYRSSACPVPLDMAEPLPTHARAALHGGHLSSLAAAAQTSGRPSELLTPCPPPTPCPGAPVASVVADPDSTLAALWSNGLQPPRILRAATTDFQLSSHKDSNVRKRVHVQKGTIPHLLQFAESTFEPGDEAERHAHESATEIFYVRSGVLSIFFDADQPGSMPPAVVSAASAASSSDAPPVAVNGTLLYELHAHDSVTIPPKRWHRMANLAEETLELVYLTLLTP